MGPFPKGYDKRGRFALIEGKAGAFGANSVQRQKKGHRLQPKFRFRIAARRKDLLYFAQNIHSRILKVPSEDPVPLKWRPIVIMRFIAELYLLCRLAAQKSEKHFNCLENWALNFVLASSFSADFGKMHLCETS